MKNSHLNQKPEKNLNKSLFLCTLANVKLLNSKPFTLNYPSCFAVHESQHKTRSNMNIMIVDLAEKDRKPRAMQCAQKILWQHSHRTKAKVTTGSMEKLIVP